MVQVTEVINGTEDTNVEVEQAENTVVENEVVDTPAVEQAQEQETLVVTIGDQKAEEDENLNFKQLRDNRRELAKENRELKRQLQAHAPPSPQLGAKPTLESMDYDTSKYETALETWQQKKIQVEAEDRAKQDAQNKATQAYQAKQASYETAKQAFKARAPDFDDAEENVKGVFSVVQQGIMVKASKDTPLLVYALHKNATKLKELAGITDPVEFTWQLAQVEASLKVTSKSNHQPEERVQGVVATGKGGDAHLAKLRADSIRTGDITAVNAYKKKMREKNVA